ncbi:Lipopolysaccharide export system protein LptC [Gammaproteobacteria bacterium]
MNTKNIFITIVLLAIFSSVSILALLEAKKITSSHTNAADAPDFFMTNTTYVQFDQNGNVNNQFYASKIIHFTSNNNYTFDNPRMKMYNTNEQPWDITANKGRSEGGKSKVYLWDNVKVVQTASHETTDFDITTTSLTVYPNIKFAETSDGVIIIQGKSIAKAVGAKADFKSGTVSLLSSVECEYQAEQTPAN